MKNLQEKITDQSLDTFLMYARDACNWNGMPLIGGNVGGSKQERGNLTDLKKKGFIKTFEEDRKCVFIEFTEKGKTLALKYGIIV